MSWLKKIWNYINRYSIGRNNSIRKDNDLLTEEDITKIIKTLDGKAARNKDNV